MKTRSIIAIVGMLLLGSVTAPRAHAWGAAEGKLYDIKRAAAAAPVAIVPGVSVGPVAFHMTRDELLKVLGTPDAIYYGDARFSLRDSPTVANYVFSRAGLSILFQWDRITSINVLSELYEYPGGVRVGMNVARAEAVLGKMREEGSVGTAHGEIEGHMVYFAGRTTYRLADYPGKSLTIKVNVDTGLIMELRNRASRNVVAQVLDVEEQVSGADSKLFRAGDARRFSGTGIKPELYVYVSYSSRFRTADNVDLYRTQPPVWRSYVLRSSTESQAEAQAASFVDALDSLGTVAPTIKAVVSQFGPPTVVELVGQNRLGDDSIGYISYGSLVIETSPSRQTLTRVQVGGRYRYKGKLGFGSTMEEVYAELGRPVQTAPEGLAGVGPDRVLFTTRYGGHILYQDVGLEFTFSRDKVVLLTRVWGP